MNNVLDFLQLAFDAQQFVSFHWVLPLAQIDFHLSELHRSVRSDFSLEQACRLELVSELHN
jgi:hypothetical protein